MVYHVHNKSPLDYEGFTKTKKGSLGRKP